MPSEGDPSRLVQARVDTVRQVLRPCEKRGCSHCSNDYPLVGREQPTSLVEADHYSQGDETGVREAIRINEAAHVAELMGGASCTRT